MSANAVKNVKKNPFFKEIIGQEEVKEQLFFLAEGANVDLGYCPPVLLIGPKGTGKTMFATAFGKSLTDEDGSPRKVVILNSSTIKSVPNFFLNIYPKILKIGKAVAVFFDEAHSLPKEFQTLLLTVCNPEKGRIRTIEHNGQPVDFNLCELAFFFATTDPQRMDKALVDRCEKAALRDYTPSELSKIVKHHCPDFDIADDAMDLIVPTMRGNGRSAVQRAQQVEKFCKIHGIDKFEKKHWVALRKRANIRPYGLDINEIQILRLLSERGECSLATLVAATGHTRPMVQFQLEPTLTRLGFMAINGKRQLTAEGHAVIKELDKE